MEKEFEDFWSVKPRRDGANPKKLARSKFLSLVARGTDPQKIISAAKSWAEYERKEKKEGTAFVAMASTWLNQERFNDYEKETILTPEEQNKIANAMGWFKIDGQWRKVKASGEDKSGDFRNAV